LLPLLCLVIALAPPLSPSAQAQTYAPFRVYLTFEDGPTDAYTPQILDILAQYSAKATFFPNGWQIAGREAILQRILREGHAIGNHLWTEPGYYAGAPEDKVREAYFQTEDALRAALGPMLPVYDAQVKLFRQPGGSAHPFDRGDGVGVITYNWNAQSDDCGWMLDESSGLTLDQQVFENLLNIPRSHGVIWNMYDFGDGVIVSMHDINRVAPRLLPAILDELVAAGATFYALPRPEDSIGTMPVALGTPPAPSPGIPGVRLQARLSDYAFIRAAPDTSAEIIIVSLPPKTALTAIGRTGDYRWFQVEYQGQVGWIWETNVRVLGPIPSLPVTLS
jgi:peptidoglycan/xylan/chitin deacetylase (PgdA/CDA1 family)